MPLPIAIDMTNLFIAKILNGKKNPLISNISLALRKHLSGREYSERDYSLKRI